MFRDLKLGLKIGAGFLCVIALAGALGVLAIVKMRAVSTGATELAQEAVPMVKDANEIERQALLTMYEIRAYGLTGQDHYLAAGREKLKAVNNALNEANELAKKYNIEKIGRAHV